MKTILLLDDNKTLREATAGNIDTYNVIPVGDKDEGISVIDKQQIDFIAVDWDLGGDETGDMLYDLLFPHGKSIPGILFTSKDLSTKSIDSLKSKGFAKIVDKIDPEEDALSDLIEKAANEILSDCVARAFHVRQIVFGIGNGDNVLKFQDEGKTIDEWIAEMENCKINEEDEPSLRELIIKHCQAYRKRKDDYGFDQI